MTIEASDLARLARRMQTGDGPLTASRIVELAVESVPDVDAASITVRARRGRYRSLGATASDVEKADAAQHELREGPCVDSIEDADWFRSSDLAGDGRWPRWGPVAAEHGFGSLLAIPLVEGDEPEASLNLYSRGTGAFVDPDVVSHAALFATHAALALQSAREITGLQTAVGSRHVIGMAQGVLMERHGLEPHQSFALLQRISSTENLKLRDVAEELISSGRLRGTPAAVDGAAEPATGASS